jgi:hypothetical protein
VSFRLHAHQADALDEIDTGKVLVGDVGSGKSITALEYFRQKHPDQKIVVITTAKKRDSGEWFEDAMKMSLRQEMEVDSWNNINKYEDLEGVSFIFDEQKLVGKGAWVKTFWKIAARNDWILLTATPADVWVDLMPVFVANGFYNNQTEFFWKHVVYKRFVRYPAIERYVDEHILEKYRDQIYVRMTDTRTTRRHEHEHLMPYSKEEEQLLYKDRWNFYEDLPVKDVSEMMRLMRKSVNSHPARYEKCKELAEEHPRIIIFYNHNYELEILRGLAELTDREVAEWNGHKHQAVPTSERWVYLVQYTAGSEGWNCITTNQTVFYSLPYSYRVLEQGKGRTDRINTPFTDLHYHTLVSNSIFDKGIKRAIRRKKNFQAGAFGKKLWPEEKVEPQQFTRLN